MIIVDCMGPYGAGKTEALVRMALQLHEVRARALICDFAMSPADGERLANALIETTGLVGGCVGCSDTRAFTRELARAVREHIEVLLCEIPPTVHGAEIVELQYRATGVRPRVLVVWDAAAHARNIGFGPAVATLALAEVVALTKASGAMSLPDVIAELAVHAAPGAVIVYWNQLDGLPREVSALHKTDASSLYTEHGPPSGRLHGHCDHCNQLAALPTTRSHGEFTQAPSESRAHAERHFERISTTIDGVAAIRLLPEAGVAPVRLLREIFKTPGVIRVKGVISHMSQLLEIQATPESESIVPFGGQPAHLGLLVYGTEPDTLRALDRLAARRRVINADSIKGLVAASTLDPDAARALIEERLALYTEIGTRREKSELHVDFGEADFAYHLAKELTHLPARLRRRAFERYITARLDSAQRLPQFVDHPRFGHYRRRLGVVLAFHIINAGEHLLKPSLVGRIRAERPWRMLAEGLETLRESELLHDTRNRVAEENPRLLFDLLRYGKAHEEDGSREGLCQLARVRRLVMRSRRAEACIRERWKELQWSTHAARRDARAYAIEPPQDSRNPAV